MAAAAPSRDGEHCCVRLGGAASRVTRWLLLVPRSGPAAFVVLIAARAVASAKSLLT
jgi:hypothetical protein